MAVATARLAGALYLLSAVAAGVPLIYVPSHLIVDGDAAATASKVLASEFVFRMCIVSELAGSLLLVSVVLLLFRLLSWVDKGQASLMVVLVLLSVPVTVINLLNETAALDLFRGAGYLAVFDKPHRDAWAMLLLDVHGDGVSLANIFWSLWLLPFGILVLKSAALPRILGVLLILNCLALMSVSFTALLAPSYLDAVSRFAVVPELGELWAMAWLLIMGARLPAAAR